MRKNLILKQVQFKPLWTKTIRHWIDCLYVRTKQIVQCSMFRLLTLVIFQYRRQTWDRSLCVCVCICIWASKRDHRYLDIGTNCIWWEEHLYVYWVWANFHKWFQANYMRVSWLCSWNPLSNNIGIVSCRVHYMVHIGWTKKILYNATVIDFEHRV